MPAFKEFPLSDAVAPIPGEPLRYHVRSQSRRGVQHLVDLEECGFNCACSCENFQMRLLPLLRADRSAGINPRPKRRCWHIRKALEFHAELSIRIISRHNKPVAPPRLEYVKKQAAYA